MRPGERKQLLLVKIPKDIAEKFNVENGRTVAVKIRADRELYRGPLKVTSGFELYLPKNLRQILTLKKAFTIALVGDKK